MRAVLGWFMLIACQLVTEIAALTMTRTDFSTHVTRGKSLNLTCDFDADGDRIYLVKWYKDDKEFFSIAPSKPGRTFPLKGVDVNRQLSRLNSVVLNSVNLATEGRYSCEVTVDVSFETVIGNFIVTVVELPERGPEISGLEGDNQMEVGDRVNVNCTCYRSRPGANLTWYINGAPSDQGSLRAAPERVDVDDMRTVTLGLDFRLRDSHFSVSGHLILKCTAQIDDVFYHSEDVRITSLTLAQRAPPPSGQAGKGNHSSVPLAIWPCLLNILTAVMGRSFTGD